ncbi:PAP2 superfamily protein [Desulfosporosinus orientis DSM 765]|uniref:PAP2 superfamily protein n=1 Tax=Desulfosporosinus orientis (strain ATCC 19365 / DSM 765 / NCIMB 8382 / VKM B-1628 / Singapore I) TaxID=768706 RepID=G7WFK8_DESOD|nr:phosphatase PAP2 family protein [Desulfosporosinus orientis]AET68451.1 PAP2 superfamily protein [Desulfosporosinus orientis DSM 765]
MRSYLTSGIWMLLIPLINLLYAPLNHVKGNVYSLITVLDQHIPFIKYFIVPYLAWYLLMFVILSWFMKRDHKLYISSLASICVGLLLSFLVYAFFQTKVPRPVIMGQDLFSNLTRFLYGIDNPYNAFPSIHVMTAYIIFVASSKAKGCGRKMVLASQTLSVLVILSTVFLKQHTLMDVAGGIFLGGSLFKAMTLIQRLNHKSLLKQAAKSFTLKPQEDKYGRGYATKRVIQE